jgi:ribosomal protein S18 acetylase RimI-like enzyme
MPSQPASGETNLFCHYDHDKLAGVATLTPGEDVEVVGTVHPAFRRKGIGLALLCAVRAECRRRGASSLVLVCEEAAPSGRAFAEAVGGTYRFSEHRMELDRAAFAQCQPSHLHLAIEEAGLQDIDALVAIRSASRDVSPGEAREAVVRWLQQGNQRFYIGRLQDQATGMLRLHQDGPRVFIQSFGVHPAHRGRGYGRQILMDVIDRLIAEDWDHILLEVATDNEVALSLYGSCGFRQMATYLYYETPCCPERA